MARRALGKGLEALLGETSTVEDLFMEVDIDMIDLSGFQPRTNFNVKRLEELAQSIRENGVIQPLMVRRQGFRFQLISGERRWRAAQMAGLMKVPVIVHDVTDDKLLELALIENIQREDLNPMEEAQAFQRLINELGLTQEDVARRVGRDRTSVTNYLRLLKLPADIQSLVEKELLSMGHARAILGLDSADQQRKLAQEVVTKGLSVRATERAVHEAQSTSARKLRPKAQPSLTADPNVRAAVEKLRQRLMTRVRIVATGRGGKLEIAFFSDEDFDRIYQIIMDRGELE